MRGGDAHASDSGEGVDADGRGEALAERELDAEGASPAAGRPSGNRLGYRFAKRGLDLLLAAAGLLVLGPLLAAVAVTVKVTSQGPIFFRQERVGQMGRPFRIVKFRTMTAGAAGPAVTRRGDPRITPLGVLLRRTKIDELPQLYNVLVGHMSLVGPRPEVRKYVERFPAEYSRILTVRPGITDFAALEYRDEESLLAASSSPEATYLETVLPAKLALYRRYLDERSLRTDLALIVRTLAALFR